MPGSHLRLKAQPFHDAGVKEYFRLLFAREGIAAERLELHDHMTDLGAHFALYNQVDIALDTDPYNGATTTCDALWMGVPVVTRAGETHVSRMAATILSAVGLDEMIARTPEEYERIAVDLAKDEARLAALRAGLRHRMATSALAAALGTLAGWVLVTQIVRAGWAFMPGLVAATVGSASLAILAFGFLGSWHALGRSGSGLLRNE